MLSLSRNLVKSIITTHVKVQSVLICQYSHCAEWTPVYNEAKNYGDKTAIIDNQGKHSYHSIYNASVQLSSRLEEVVKSGDRVAMLTPNNAEYVRSQWAIWMSGAVCVPLCKSHPASTLSYYLQVTGNI